MKKRKAKKREKVRKKKKRKKMKKKKVRKKKKFARFSNEWLIGPIRTQNASRLAASDQNNMKLSIIE